MINTLARVDQLASAGRSPWHRASAIAKLLLAAAIVTLAIAAPSVSLLAALYLVAATLALGARLPVRLILAAAGYPIVFSTLFVISTWDGTWRTPARLLLRPLTASLVAVWLVGTTPYPDLFAPLSRALPRSVGDGLFLTYRALFELIARAERWWRALRQRSQRQYAAMLLRGHSGRVCGCRHWAEWTRADARVALAGALVAALAVLLWGRA